MAEKFDDGGYWLPSEFLTDEELLTDFKTESFKPKRVDEVSYGFCNSFGVKSDLSSPVESVTVSTETEGEENDFIEFLTRKLTYSTLNDMKISSNSSTKGWKLCGSPQSTLYGYKPGSSRTSPEYISGVSSPPDVKDTVEWDFIFAAAEDIARRVNEERTTYYPTKIVSPSLKPCPVTFTRTNPSLASEFYSNSKTQAQLSYQQFRLTGMNRENWGPGGIGSQFQNVERDRKTQGLSTGSWPTLLHSQQQAQPITSSRMRAVFLPENGAKKERTGTGVFLPRRYGVNYPETRRKPSCSSVLLPDRVVQALNMKLDSIEISANSQSKGNANFTPNYEAALKNRTNAMISQKMRNFKPQSGLNQELWLPPEWTY